MRVRLGVACALAALAAAAAVGALAGPASAGLMAVLSIYEKGPVAIPNGSGAARLTFPARADDIGTPQLGIRVRHTRTQLTDGISLCA